MCFAQTSKGSMENSQCISTSQKTGYQSKAVAEHKRQVVASIKNISKKTNYKSKFPAFWIAIPAALKFPIQKRGRREFMFQDKTVTVPWDNMTRKSMRILIVEAQIFAVVCTFNHFMVFFTLYDGRVLDFLQISFRQIIGNETYNAEPNVVYPPYHKCEPSLCF